jgi:hypothetical protein
MDKTNRPVFFGDKFNLSFQPQLLFPGLERTDIVSIGTQSHHEQLHKINPKPKTMGRGNSIAISWELYYYTNDTGLHRKIIAPEGMPNIYKSADFHEHTKTDLNDLFAMGKHITSGQQFNTTSNFNQSSSQVHSERSFMVVANRNELVKNLSDGVNDVLFSHEPTATPWMLMIQLHSHENEICPTCYQFLESFMSGGWIDEFKAKVIDGNWMQVKMVTSSDEKVTTESQSKNKVKKQTFTVHDEDFYHGTKDEFDDDEKDPNMGRFNPLPNIFNFNQHYH